MHSIQQEGRGTNKYSIRKQGSINYAELLPLFFQIIFIKQLMVIFPWHFPGNMALCIRHLKHLTQSQWNEIWKVLWTSHLSAWPLLNICYALQDVTFILNSIYMLNTLPDWELPKEIARTLCNHRSISNLKHKFYLQN